MFDIQFKGQEILFEKNRIIEFLSQSLKGKKAVIGISGGLDSDVVARLVALSIGADNVKLFLVIQSGMEKSHITNARDLAIDLGIHLHEIDLKEFPMQFINELAKADFTENFKPEGLLDVSRAKCSLRTPVLSTYQDRGYIVIGTSNLTESKLGFFLPFGDGIAHIKPIAHLYKTQVRQISDIINTRKAVLDQPASAGFWEGETDIEDIAYWLYNKAPIQQEQSFTDDNINLIKDIKNELTTELVDLVIHGIDSLKLNNQDIHATTGMSLNTIDRFRSLIKASREFKNRPYNLQLNPRIIQK